MSNKRIIITVEGLASPAKEKLVNILYNESSLAIIPNTNLYKPDYINGHKDINDIFSENPYKFSYVFKSYQLLSKLDAYIKASSYAINKNTVILDGSIDSEKYIFTPMFLGFKFFTNDEAGMYNMMCDWYINNLHIKYNGAIYVKTPYKEIYNKKKNSNGIDKKQYSEITKNYEIWMLESSFPILAVDSSEIMKEDTTIAIQKIMNFISYLR
ncbi:deoxycytidine kinase-like protein [Fowlpox virus]|nr:deoxycytidine kinase-like protein [Fowlpox virus]